MHRIRILPFFLLSAIVLLLYSSCYQPNNYYLVGSKEQKQELKRLFTHLDKQTERPEGRFIVLQQIIRILISTDHMQKGNLLLTTYIEKHPDDPYNGYYLFIVAQNYMQNEAYPFAAQYFERILRNYPDLLVRGKSIHLNCLRDLIKLTSNPEAKVTYYKELLSRFSDQINKGLTYYYLGSTYEKLGEWDLAVQAYMNYLKYPDTHIPNVPNARQEIESMVAMYTYDGPSWSMDNLDDLAQRIKWAINRGDVATLKRLVSKVDFFTGSWEQKESANEDTLVPHLGTFLNSRVHYARTLDRDSNAQEAYLKTTGWSYRIATWYLYFKRIYFPADPEKHGQWEWAGIYFGEKPFAGSKEDKEVQG